MLCLLVASPALRLAPPVMQLHHRVDTSNPLWAANVGADGPTRAPSISSMSDAELMLMKKKQASTMPWRGANRNPGDTSTSKMDTALPMWQDQAKAGSRKFTGAIRNDRYSGGVVNNLRLVGEDEVAYFLKIA